MFANLRKNLTWYSESQYFSWSGIYFILIFFTRRHYIQIDALLSVAQLQDYFKITVLVVKSE